MSPIPSKRYYTKEVYGKGIVKIKEVQMPQATEDKMGHSDASLSAYHYVRSPCTALGSKGEDILTRERDHYRQPHRGQTLPKYTA